MWKKNHTWVVICLGIVLLLGWQVNAGTVPETISLKEAVESALQHSIDLKITELEWDNSQIAYQKAMADNLLTQSIYNQRSAELNLMKADAAYKKSIANAVITAVRRFAEVDLAMMNLQVKEHQLQLSQKALALTQKKVSMQNASEYDLLQAEAALTRAQFDCERDQDSLEEKKQAFFLLINTEAMVPDGKLNYVPFEVDLAKVIPHVLESSVDVREAEDSLELARLDLERLLLEETADLLVREARNRVALAELRVEQTKNTIVQEVQSAFNTVKQAKQSYESSCLSHELEVRQYQITKGQVDAGLKTEDDLLKAQISLREAERSIYDALTNYVIACLQFDQLIGNDIRDSTVFLSVDVGEDG